MLGDVRWCSYVSPSDGLEHAGVVHGDQVHGVRDTLLELLRADRLQDAAADAFEVVPLGDVTLLAPIPVPPSMRDFMSFESHVVTSMEAIGSQVDPVWYQQPVFYFTNPAAVLPPVSDVPIAPGSEQFDFELEVAAIIGRGGSDISPADAESHIAGYTIFCDWSARDLQMREMRVGLGPAKGKDTATSLGPVMVTLDELEPFRTASGYDLTMTVSVNGREYSHGSWQTVYWTFAQMIAYASRGTELRPGDVIGSGTVGTGCILELGRVHGGDAYPWLAVGDVVEIDVEQLGTQRARIVAGPAIHPLS
jgi:2-keto-4-pentenoate hydratase/2-oxohepta-3-ene-1,7-dioic acid hydratase in catechol pathway